MEPKKIVLRAAPRAEPVVIEFKVWTSQEVKETSLEALNIGSEQDAEALTQVLGQALPAATFLELAILIRSRLAEQEGLIDAYLSSKQS